MKLSEIKQKSLLGFIKTKFNNILYLKDTNKLNYIHAISQGLRFIMSLQTQNREGKLLIWKLLDIKKVYKTMTLWHTSQQDPLWPTSQNIGNKSKNKQMGPN